MSIFFVDNHVTSILLPLFWDISYKIVATFEYLLFCNSDSTTLFKGTVIQIEKAMVNDR